MNDALLACLIDGGMDGWMDGWVVVRLEIEIEMKGCRMTNCEIGVTKS